MPVPLLPDQEDRILGHEGREQDGLLPLESVGAEPGQVSGVGRGLLSGGSLAGGLLLGDRDVLGLCSGLDLDGRVAGRLAARHRRFLSCPSRKTHPESTPGPPDQAVLTNPHCGPTRMIAWSGHIDSNRRLGAVSGLESRIEHRPPCPGRQVGGASAHSGCVRCTLCRGPVFTTCEATRAKRGGLRGNKKGPPAMCRLSSLLYVKVRRSQTDLCDRFSCICYAPAI